MTKRPANPKPSPAPGTSSRHARPGAILITKTINAAQLLGELHAQWGVTGTLLKQGDRHTLTVHDRGQAATDAPIQAVIAAHTPAPPVPSPAAQLQNWATLTPAQKDALLLGALKKVYGVP